MSSFVSTILHSSANKIESMSMLGSKNKSKAKQNAQQQQHSNLASRLAIHASTPVLNSSNNNSGGYYFHPQMSYSAEYIPAPPPYDPLQQQQQQLLQQQLHSPTPTPSTSWTSEMSALAEKIKDDVTNTFKGSSKQTPTALSLQQQSNIDRHSISQGMKLVSIAADEYEEGNESVALDIYLTGVDKILMALPNKTDMTTKMAIREKLQSVEERVGILNLATSQKKIQQQQLLEESSENFDNKNTNSIVNSFILSRIASTISTISSKAYQSATTPTSIVEVDDNDGVVPVMTSAPMPSIYIEGGGDSMAKFKRFGQYMIDVTVTCAILIKQSPLPDLISFMFGYLIQVFLWVDSQYHVMQKVQNLGIQCIKFGLQADEQYRLHEFISEGLYMMVAAGLKAAVAFKETPRYDNNRSSKPQHIRNRSEPAFINSAQNTTTANRRNSDPVNQQQQSTSPCSPPTPQKTRASWAWSRW